MSLVSTLRRYLTPVDRTIVPTCLKVPQADLGDRRVLSCWKRRNPVQGERRQDLVRHLRAHDHTAIVPCSFLTCPAPISPHTCWIVRVLESRRPQVNILMMYTLSAEFASGIVTTRWALMFLTHEVFPPGVRHAGRAGCMD